MKKTMAAALTLSLLSVLALAAANGTWAAELRSDGKLQFQIRYDHSSHSTSYPLESFQGLTKSAIQSAALQPVTFRWVKDAGTLTFEGSFKEGEGAGHFAFAPSADFYAEMQRLGVRIPSKGSREDDEQLSLAMFDVSRELVRELNALGFRELDLDQLISVRIHGATPQYIRELKDLGIEGLNIDDLVSLRIHGATPEFIREMHAAGFRFDADELVSMRIHGVKPDFVRELQAQGYTKLDVDDLVSMRIHGVTTEYVRDLYSLGYRNIPADDLVSMRIHGVTTKFIRELHDAGYTNVPVEKLIQMRIHGIDSTFVKALKKNGQ